MIPLPLLLPVRVNVVPFPEQMEFVPVIVPGKGDPEQETVNSSAPRSGVTELLVSPSKSVVTRAIGVPRLSNVVFEAGIKWRSLTETNTGKMLVELASPAEDDCHPVRFEPVAFQNPILAGSEL